MENLSRYVILDTSIVVRYLRSSTGPETDFGERFDGWAVTPVVVGELYAGAYRSQNFKRNVLKILHFLESAVLIRHTDRTPEFFGCIFFQLTSAGTPIPQNDIWLASIGIEFGLPFATADSHFERVAGWDVIFA